MIPTPDRCLSFTVQSGWGHFRKVDGNIVKRTYHAPPRTTVAGMIAAILGLPRDTYYGTFSKNGSAMAISPTESLRTMSIPVNTVSTSSLKRVGNNPKGVKVSIPDHGDDRQQHNYEVLVEPGYRVEVWLDDTDQYEQLKTYLEEGKSTHPVSMGLSEYLARITYHGEHTVEENTNTDAAVQSVIPGAGSAVTPTPGVEFVTERVPGFMEQYENGRRTTEYLDVAVPVAGEPLKTSADVHRVTDSSGTERNVVFL